MLVRLDIMRAAALGAGRRAPIFLDIGANVGSYSLAAAAHGFRFVTNYHQLFSGQTGASM